MLPTVTPQLVANNGLSALRAAIADPDRYVVEPKVDGVRGLVVYREDRAVETRNRHGVRRDWLRRDDFELGLRRLGDRLPLLWQGTVLDGELTTGRFATTMSALLGSKRHRAALRFVVFDVPVLAGVDFRPLPWQQRRDRLELLAQAFDLPLELSPIVSPSRALAIDITDGRLEGIVLKDRRSPYKDGTRAGWWKVKDPRWLEREAWRSTAAARGEPARVQERSDLLECYSSEFLEPLDHKVGEDQNIPRLIGRLASVHNLVRSATTEPGRSHVHGGGVFDFVASIVEHLAP